MRNGEWYGDEELEVVLEKVGERLRVVALGAVARRAPSRQKIFSFISDLLVHCAIRPATRSGKSGTAGHKLFETSTVMSLGVANCVRSL